MHCSAPVLLSLVMGFGCATVTPAPTEGGRPAPAPMATGVAEIKVSPTPLTFDLDERVWHEQRLEPPGNTDVVATRSFRRDPASPQAECPAALAIVAERVPGDVSIVDYSAAKRSGMPPHQMEKVFSHQEGLLQLKNAVGYRLRGSMGCFPVVYLVHALGGSYGFTIVVETDPHDYAVIEQEIMSLLKSFHVGAAG